MDFLKIQGGNPLIGEIEVSGSKHSAFPIIASGLMVDGCLTLKNVPDLADTKLMLKLLNQLGMDIKINNEEIEITGNVKKYNAPYDLVKKMRASILVLGPLLSKYGFAQVSLPGGCAIGTRPVDLHIKTMQSLGAIVELADGYIQAKASRGLIVGKIVFPFISVGATENAIMAAIFAKGTLVDLLTNGVVLLARGFTSRTYNISFLCANCMLMSPMTFNSIASIVVISSISIIVLDLI